MALWNAELIGPWHPDRIPQIARDYTGLRMSETTGQPAVNITPDPNLVTTWIECEAAILDAIEKDNAYCILWSEEIVEGF